MNKQKTANNMVEKRYNNKKCVTKKWDAAGWHHIVALLFRLHSFIAREEQQIYLRKRQMEKNNKCEPNTCFCCNSVSKESSQHVLMFIIWGEPFFS